MARRHNSRRSESAPGWVWMLFGLGVGLIIAIGVYLRAPDRRPERVAGDDRSALRGCGLDVDRRATIGGISAAAAAHAGCRETLRVLRNPAAVRGRDPGRRGFRSTDRAAAAGDRRGTRQLPAAGGLVQRRRATRIASRRVLRLLGFESHVQRVTIEDDVFNRVRIGPISDLDAARRIQRQLRDAGIDPLLMKVPN